MPVKTFFRVAICSLLALSVLSACGGDDDIRTNPYNGDNTFTSDNTNNNNTTTGTIGADGTIGVEELSGDALLRETRIIYFDYDSALVKPEYRDVLAAHARYLRNNPQVKARLEGHADERGSREYNLGLGQNRAESTRQFIMLTGVSGGQLQSISYGEEKPASFGAGESSWSQNRRVEIKY